MSKEMVISSNRHETRVALLEDDQLVEVHFQRAHEYSLAGSIHKGRVTRVLPGMQSAFVDLGLERDTFLYVSDFLEEHEDEDIDHVTGPGTGPGAGSGAGNGRHGRDRGRERRQALPAQQGDRPAIARPLGDRPTSDRPSSDRPSSDRPSTARPSSEAEPGADAQQMAQEGAPSAPQGAADRSAAPRPDGRPDGRGDGRGNDDRRGRRSRRRRNRRGLPESKYAEPNATEEPISSSPDADEDAEPEMSAASETTHETAPESAPIILPGESLRKYRSAPEAPAVVEHHAVAPSKIAPDDFEVKGVDEYNLPVHYPPENALPDAPVHHPLPSEDASEEIPVKPAVVPGVEAPPAHATDIAHEPAAHEHVAVEHDAVEHDAVEHDDEAEGGPAVASLLDEDEDLDIQAMILGEVESLDEREAAGDSATSSAEPAADSGTPGAEPQSGSAEVRERGSRYPHRGSRRGRRRPRGSQDVRQGDVRQGDARQGDGRPTDGRSGDGRPQVQEPRSLEGAAPEGNAEPRGEMPAPQSRVVSRPVHTSAQTSGQPSISDLLKEGQEIIVQIAKEPLGQKGARITSHIALPGRYVVFMPTLEHMGVSRKIASDEERQRLKRILQGRRPGPGGGFITRTAAEGRTEDEIGADMEFLYKLWQDIKNKAERKPAPLLLHHDLDIVQRVLRDQLTDSFKSIWIDNEELYENIMSFVQRFQPALVGKVKLYTREAPIFDAFGITAELEKALRPKVWLKSGGYIVINQTEALVAIDVNTGKYVGKSNRLEDTIVKTNTEAIKEIVRQIRLRDLGGIIVIDFIDMDERKNRQKVMQALEEAMRVDRAPYKILQFNDFGLVAITRKRVKQSLERTLCSPCPHCDGGGYIKSVATVVGEILTEARKMAGSVEGKEVVLRTHPDVAKVLKSNQNKYLEELEEVLRRPVLIKSDPLLHNEKFDLA